MSFQNKISAKNTLFFFILLAIIIDLLNYLFNFITPLLNLVNGIFLFGWTALVFNDLIVIINVIYMFVLIILGCLIFNNQGLKRSVMLILSILILVAMIKDPSEFLNLVYFITSMFGSNSVINLIPANQFSIYLAYWGLTGLMGVLILSYLIFFCVKFIFRKIGNIEFITFLYSFLILYSTFILIHLVFNMIFSAFYGPLILYIIIEDGIYMGSLYAGLIFLNSLRREKESPKLYLFGNLSFILLGISKILLVFNEINVETSIYIVLGITLGVILILVGIIFKKRMLNSIQNR